ncbi:hypothetical protein HPB51_014655 [Rhipicephalus microplus]|uniref:Uncharacterized protein n=1 Tax=Rhipicephalus microplus TaxID=6941 RepID=A0A9J6F3I1_RHIMP|nr:hypothetical protein HPB51_014655 [Rhipicephalus microplus]
MTNGSLLRNILAAGALNAVLSPTPRCRRFRRPARPPSRVWLNKKPGLGRHPQECCRTLFASRPPLCAAGKRSRAYKKQRGKMKGPSARLPTLFRRDVHKHASVLGLCTWPLKWAGQHGCVRTGRHARVPNALLVFRLFCSSRLALRHLLTPTTFDDSVALTDWTCSTPSTDAD